MFSHNLKERRRWGLASAMLALTLGTISCSRPQQAQGGDLLVSWEVLRNYASGAESRFEAELTLTNRGLGSLPPSGWSLYYNTLAGNPPLEVGDGIEVEHINGGFFRIVPGNGFPSLGSGESAAWRLTFSGWSVSESDAPSGFYLVYGDSKGKESVPQLLPPVAVRPFVTAEQTQRSPHDRIPVTTPQLRYERNQTVTRLDPKEVPLLVPTAYQTRPAEGSWSLNPEVRVHFARGLDFEAGYLASSLGELLGTQIHAEQGRQKGPLIIVLDLGQVGNSPEAYQLRVSPQGVSITGASPAGVFYGIQSLRQLIPVSAYSSGQAAIEIKAVSILDQPRFAYRGLHLDVARNFQTQAEVVKLLDLMAFYKLNRFHFHFVDDEGWRWEVRGLPELTQVGGRRGHTLNERDHLIPAYGSGPSPEVGKSSGSGFYTREQLIQILQHAHQRHIEVIPEIDVPGHSRAAIKAMEARARRLEAEGSPEAAAEFRLIDPEDRSQYRSIQGFDDNVVNVCQESTYRFLGRVFDELIEIYREAGVPLKVIHVGGDEVPEGVWEDSPTCRQLLEGGIVSSLEELPSYLIRRLTRLVEEREVRLGGWEEIGLKSSGDHAGKEPNPEFAGNNFQVYFWNSVWGEPAVQNGYRLANAGYPVVLCNASSLYLDLAYEKDPQELGQAWAGYIGTRQPFEFAPLDYYQNGRSDFFGREIAPDFYAQAARLSDAGRKNILGIQGHLWSEAMTSPAKLEYMAFPKLLSLAERAWASRPEWAAPGLERVERDRLLAAAWNRFANQIGQVELARLDYLYGGVFYRIPPPGARVVEGVLYANVALPGLEVRYSTDGNPPTLDSSLYTQPVEVSGPVTLRSFNAAGRGSRPSVVQ